MELDKNKTLDSYLSFKLGDELYAANVAKVLNILEMVKITKVPKAPDYMKGVINLRGSVLPVIDTRIKFGMSETEYSKSTCILVLDIIVDGDDIQVGALVDSVQEVLEIHEDSIQPPPNIGSKYRSEFIFGMMKNDEEFIMLLDMDKVFSLTEIVALKENTTETEIVVEESAEKKKKK